MGKKTIALTLAAAMLTGLLMGCGSGNPDSTAAQAGGGYSMPLEKPASVSIMCNENINGASLADTRAWQEFERLTNIDLEWNLIGGYEYGQVAKVRLSSGVDLADIVRLPNTDSDSKFQNSGVFIPLNDLIEEYGVNTKKLLEERPDLRAQLTNERGEIYFLSSIDMPSSMFVMLLLNKDWLAQVGMEQPTTVEEFYEVLKAFRGRDFNHNGEADEIPFSATRFEMAAALGPAFGLDFVNGFTVDENGQVEATIGNPRLREYLTFLNRLYSEGLLDKAYASKTGDQICTNVISDQIGATADWSFNLKIFNKNLLNLDYNNYGDCTWTGLMPLASEFSDATLFERTELGSFFGITKTCEDPVTAFLALDYILGEEFQNILNWGQEGVDWEYGEDGQLYRIPLAEGVDPGAAGAGVPGTMMIQDVTAVYELLSDWHIALDKKLQTYAVDGFPHVYGTEQENAVLMAYESDMKTFASEQINLFITGERSLDEFDDYLQTLRDMGIQDVVAVKQAQYDRYMADLRGE